MATRAFAALALGALLMGGAGASAQGGTPYDAEVQVLGREVLRALMGPLEACKAASDGLVDVAISSYQKGPDTVGLEITGVGHETGVDSELQECLVDAIELHEFGLPTEVLDAYTLNGTVTFVHGRAQLEFGAELLP